jgi:hypothetical protein
VASVTTLQDAVCRWVHVTPELPAVASKVGISRNVSEDIWPLNGLRHPPTGDTNGWYLWRGSELSDAANFFTPLHVEHLPDLCAAALPYLALPPGWRFLIAPNHEDVWFDEALLAV